MGRAFKIPEGSLDNTIFDEKNPEALINLVPDRVKPILHRLKPKMPRILYCTEGELRVVIKPDERDERLRLSFWDEYNHSTHVKKSMSLAAILQGVTSWETWVNVYERSDRKMMWILCPPVSYQASMRLLIHKGTERLLEIMTMPIRDEKGRIDHKAVLNILKCFQLVDLRVKGAITQKVQIQQQSLNVNHNINQDMPGDSRMIDNMQLEDLEKLERRIDKARRDGNRIIDGLPDEEKEVFIEATVNDGAVPGGLLKMPELEGEDLDGERLLEMQEESV